MGSTFVSSQAAEAHDAIRHRPGLLGGSGALARGWTLAGAVQPLHQAQTRAASSSAKAKAKGAAKGKDAAGKSGAGASEVRVRTPEWAQMPSQLSEVQDLLRKRKPKLYSMRRELEADAATSSSRGWTGEAKSKAALATAAALPLPPDDGGKAELAKATASDTPFEEARGIMVDLMRRGVVLEAEAHLGPLLRKADGAAALSGGLALLRTNHLLQAAVRRGQHAPQHSGLHSVLAQECKRLGSAAPLVELWDSLHEHGVEPTAGAAAEAVRVAVELADARAAATLLALSCQYGREPLAPAEAAAVLALVEAGSAEDGASLRQLLPKLGLRVA